MLWAMIKKDLLHLIRVKRELSTLLVMPAVLIAILGYALGGVMNPEPTPLNVQVAVIREGNVKKELEQFKKDLARSPFTPEERFRMAKKAEHFVPSDILVRNVLRGEKGKKAFAVREISPEERESFRRDDRFAGILTIPKDFDLRLWRSLFLHEKSAASLKLELNESRSLQGQCLKSAVESFRKQIIRSGAIYQSLELAGPEKIDPDFFALDPTPPLRGEITSLKGRKPLSSFEYFTVGMSTMFLLHAAAFTARLASEERGNRTLDRIALAGVPAWRFWAGKWLSTFLLALIQLFSLFGYAALAFDVSWQNPSSFLIVTFLLAFVAGSLAVFLMAISFRFNTSWVVELFSTGLVVILGFLGGSFFKTDILSEWLGRLGEWIPNGAALTAYLGAMQGSSPEDLIEPLTVLIGWTAAFLLAAAGFKPERGRVP